MILKNKKTGEEKNFRFLSRGDEPKLVIRELNEGTVHEMHTYDHLAQLFEEFEDGGKNE